MSETVRLLLSVAATEIMEVVSLDLKTAFLYGLISITQFIDMRRPGRCGYFSEQYGYKREYSGFRTHWPRSVNIVMLPYVASDLRQM